MKPIRLLIAFSYLLFLTGLQAEEPQRLESLRLSYEAEMKRVMETVQSKYVDALDDMVRSYTRSGDLETAVAVRDELIRAQQWESLPVASLRAEAMEEMTREDFHQWLKSRRFSFSGVSNVELQFGEDSVKWITRVETRDYPYTITSKRNLTIQGNQDYYLEFAEDLQAGKFESNRGEYELRIESR